jgi:hypothetical protein
VPHPRADPGHPGELHADSTVLFRFLQLRPPLTRGASAHLTTRTPTRADATPAITGHMRNEGAENWWTTPTSRSATRARQVATRSAPGGIASRLQPGTSLAPGRSALGCPGWPGGTRCFRGSPTAANSAVPDLHLDLGRRLAARFRPPCPIADLAAGKPAPEPRFALAAHGVTRG